MTEKNYSVPDVSCNHCKMAIERALGRLPGVQKVEVHVEEKTVDVAYDEEKVSEEQIRSTLEEEGYPVAG